MFKFFVIIFKRCKNLLINSTNTVTHIRPFVSVFSSLNVFAFVKSQVYANAVRNDGQRQS